jgi:hypothetical protein
METATNGEGFSEVPYIDGQFISLAEGLPTAAALYHQLHERMHGCVACTSLTKGMGQMAWGGAL